MTPDDIRTRLAALPEERRKSVLLNLADRQEPTSPGTDSYDCDVAVVGGGPAGLTLALQLKRARPASTVLVVERQQYPVPEATHKVGESTVEIAAHYLRDILGMGDHLDNGQLRKFGLRMFFSCGDNSDISERVEIGSTEFPPVATYQLDRGRLENALQQAAHEAGIETITNATVTDLRLRNDAPAHGLTIDHDGTTRDVTARWVVDASGRRRLIQRQLNLATRTPHRANAVWFRIEHPIDIKEWTDDTGWHARVAQGDRALSTNHLMGQGYWVWLIRLASGYISIGIVTDADEHRFEEMNRLDRALVWLSRHEPQCAKAVEHHRDRIRDFRVMKDYSYGTRQVFSGQGRWCLSGEAALFLDPLYSPGLDLIAIGNGLTTDLLTRDLDGEDIQGRAEIHDRLFLTLTDIWLGIYSKQYQLMGNSQVMISKIVWDTAFYWGVFGHLYFHDQFARVAESPALANALGSLAKLSNRVQAFFREWNAIDEPGPRVQFVDLYAPLNFMVEMHHGLILPADPGEFENRFEKNVRRLEQLAGQLVSTVILAYANDSKRTQVYEQIRHWQMDPHVAGLVDTYRRESRTNPTNDGWITLAGQKIGVAP